MTQAEMRQVEDRVREGLRIIGRISEQLILTPSLPLDPPKPQADVAPAYRTLIGNSTAR
jgi:hypothetical protein